MGVLVRVWVWVEGKFRVYKVHGVLVRVWVWVEGKFRVYKAFAGCLLWGYAVSCFSIPGSWSAGGGCWV